MRPTFYHLMAPLLLLAVGCGQAEVNERSPAGPAPTQFGVVSGMVRFAGEPPPMRTLPGRPCHESAGPMVDQSVLVGPDGGLRHVVVFVRGAVPAPAAPLPPARLEQLNGRFMPRVVAVRVGQGLEVVNLDPCLYNVHGAARRNAAINLTQVSGAVDLLSFTQPETIALRSDIHPWMTGFVRVFDHDYFAVTGEDGRFVLARAPAGRYTLVAWHERYGEISQAVEIAADGAVNVDFTYRNPSR